MMMLALNWLTLLHAGVCSSRLYRTKATRMFKITAENCYNTPLTDTFLPVLAHSVDDRKPT
jgi:hypothetical protein